MNWLEWLGVLEIIQLGVIVIIILGQTLRGGKKDETDSRYYVHGLTGPEPCSSSGVGMEHECHGSMGSTDDQLAQRRNLPEGDIDTRTVRHQDFEPEYVNVLLADHRLRHGRYDYPPAGPLDQIDQLRERSDADRAATRAGQADKLRMVNDAQLADRNWWSTHKVLATPGGVRVVESHNDGDER